jgi:hypothetical protein
MLWAALLVGMMINKTMNTFEITTIMLLSPKNARFL